MNVQKLAARFQDLNLNGSDLSVEVRRENPKDRRVTSVTISGRIDSDCGPDDGLEYRGETFYRIENYKRVAEGTGLGLHLCRHIVETVHQGQIGLDSKLGMGSRFWFSVPMGEEAAMRAA